MNGLNRGRLRERVRLEALSLTDNGQGGQEETWTPVATVAAEIVGLSGAEAMKAGIDRSVQQWRVTISCRDTVTAKHRLMWIRAGGAEERLEIQAAMPDPKAPRDATLLLCESGAIS
ncbi:MAG TPA: phage head closure protein [Allosphingosinicella sp.]